MDFTTIMCKLSPKHFNHYQVIQEFVHDVQLVFENCKTFNGVSTVVEFTLRENLPYQNVRPLTFY